MKTFGYIPDLKISKDLFKEVESLKSEDLILDKMFNRDLYMTILNDLFPGMDYSDFWSCYGYEFSGCSEFGLYKFPLDLEKRLQEEFDTYIREDIKIGFRYQILRGGPILPFHKDPSDVNIIIPIQHNSNEITTCVLDNEEDTMESLLYDIGDYMHERYIEMFPIRDRKVLFEENILEPFIFDGTLLHSVKTLDGKNIDRKSLVVRIFEYEEHFQSIFKNIKII